MRGDGSTSKPGGIIEVAMWLSSILGLVPNYVVLVLGNEVGGPHHITTLNMISNV
jgi:hypothetical protein